jgi:hypothetical protein
MEVSKEQREIVLVGLRANGCTCDPNVTADGPIARGEVTNVRIQHDDWCPLIQRIESSHN